jgi:hypothetical protein
MEFAQSRVSKPDQDDASDGGFDQLLQSIPDQEEDSFEAHVRSYVGRSRVVDDSSKYASAVRDQYVPG